MRDSFAYSEQLVRDHDKDRFLSTLFAPADRRPYLFALYAFALEIGRVKHLVHEPMAGIIRLQWWTDAITGSRAEEAAANPVAGALLETIAQTGLPIAFLTRAIEQRQEELQGEPAVGAEAAILAAAVHVLSATGVSADMIDNAARAMTAVRESPDPGAARDAYAAFYVRRESLPAAALPAFLPVALVPVLTRNPGAPQWRRQLILLRAAWFGLPKPIR
jgi:phytoene synthase